jgi:hypothetical protein
MFAFLKSQPGIQRFPAFSATTGGSSSPFYGRIHRAEALPLVTLKDFFQDFAELHNADPMTDGRRTHGLRVQHG